MRTRQSTRGRRVTLVVASVSDDEEYDDPAADDDDDDAYHEEATETASRAAEDDSDLDASLDELDDAASVTTDGLGGAAGPLATGDEDNVSALTLYGLSQNKRAMYMGPVRRSTQSTLLLRELYGPDPDNVAIAWGLLGRWPPTRVLPSKLPHPDICTVPSPWVAEGFEESQRALLRDLLTEAQHGGLGRPASAFTRLKPEDGRRYLPPSAGDEIVTFSGRHGGEMKRLVFRQGASVLTSYAGEPLCDDENLPASECGGWMIDVGGTVVGMAWAPLDGEGDQVLGLSVIPFADQTASKSKSDTVSDSATTTGSIQLWCFPSQDADGGFVRPSKERPKLVQTICTDRDGITTLQWCPLPYSSDSTLGILAFLSRDGMVRVIAVSKDRGEETIFSKTT